MESFALNLDHDLALLVHEVDSADPRVIAEVDLSLEPREGTIGEEYHHPPFETGRGWDPVIGPSIEEFAHQSCPAEASFRKRAVNASQRRA